MNTAKKLDTIENMQSVNLTTLNYLLRKNLKKEDEYQNIIKNQ